MNKARQYNDVKNHIRNLNLEFYNYYRAMSPFA